MAVKQPNMKAADSPIVMKAGDTAARETAAQKAVEATINETPEVARTRHRDHTVWRFPVIAVRLS